jgi:prepilin-type N-terminal cleavage/methylation domain-containing protein
MRRQPPAIPRCHGPRPRCRRGFTLIELLTVLVVLGVIVLFGSAQLRRSRARALETALHNDLRNLRTTQELYLGQAGTYSTDLATLGFAPTAGVTLAVLEADDAGWAATANHPSARRSQCALFVGRVATVPLPATDDGEIACH